MGHRDLDAAFIVPCHAQPHASKQPDSLLSEFRRTVMVIDAEHCRAVNDTYGYRARVAVLRHLAAGIAAVSHTIDFVARFGGKKFVMTRRAPTSRLPSSSGEFS